jgi:hypothetical protein
MNWRFVLGYGSLGVLLGIGRLYGWIPAHLEMPVWLGLGFVWVTAAMRKVPQAAFQHVFMTALLTAFLAGDVQAIFLSTYLANNPIPLNETGQQILTPPTSTFLLVSYLFVGALYGVFTGLVAALLVRFTAPKKELGREGPEPPTMLPARPPMDTHSPPAAAAVAAASAAEPAREADESEEE